MKIYTKTGDGGTTALIGGTRVAKYNDRIEAYGTIDELIAFTANLASHRKMDRHTIHILEIVVERLMVCAALMANEKPENTANLPQITGDDIVVLEKEMDAMDTKLPPLSSFILPMGHEIVTRCHIARTVCRRAERLAVKVNSEDMSGIMTVKYLNRLSDYFFVLARKLSKDRKMKEILWNPFNIR